MDTMEAIKEEIEANYWRRYHETQSLVEAYAEQGIVYCEVCQLYSVERV